MDMEWYYRQVMMWNNQTAPRSRQPNRNHEKRGGEFVARSGLNNGNLWSKYTE